MFSEKEVIGQKKGKTPLSSSREGTCKWGMRPCTGSLRRRGGVEDRCSV